MTRRSRAVLKPSSEAQRLAQQMVVAHDTMRDILDETLTSAEEGNLLESGRTVCGDETEIRGPVARYPLSVELATCPVGASGVWHTHATPSQLKNPENSLPDIANAVFGTVDVHIVVGTESAEVFMAADERKSAQDAYRNAVGEEVASTAQVVAALQAGRIPDPAEARIRVREALAPLVKRVPTGYEDLTARVPAQATPLFSPEGPDVNPQFPTLAAARADTYSPDVGRMREQSRATADAFRVIVDKYGIKEDAISNATGIIVGSLISRLLGL